MDYSTSGSTIIKMESVCVCAHCKNCGKLASVASSTTPTSMSTLSTSTTPTAQASIVDHLAATPESVYLSIDDDDDSTVAACCEKPEVQKPDDKLEKPSNNNNNNSFSPFEAKKQQQGLAAKNSLVRRFSTMPAIIAEIAQERRQLKKLKKPPQLLNVLEGKEASQEIVHEKIDANEKAPEATNANCSGPTLSSADAAAITLDATEEEFLAEKQIEVAASGFCTGLFDFWPFSKKIAQK